MKTLGYYNGTVDELEAMRIPMLDRASYFGDGVYDVTYCRNYRIFALDEHVDRFFQSAELLKITPPLSKNELKVLLNELVGKLESGNQWVYFQLSRGTELRNHPFHAVFQEFGIVHRHMIRAPSAQRNPLLITALVFLEGFGFFFGKGRKIGLTDDQFLFANDRGKMR